MSKPLTPKQKRVLDAIRTYRRFKGYMPSVRDLTKLTKSAVGTVHEQLLALKEKGWIKITGQSRGIVLTEPSIDPNSLSSVPIRGTIAAGSHIEALETMEDPVILPRNIAGSGSFALRVKGSSMIEDHILDGDIVVVKPQSHVTNGEIAVALLDDNTATLRRIYKERKRIRLQPVNRKMRPLYVRRSRIQGKVTAILRVSR